MSEWISTSIEKPPQDRVVMTKIHDDDGIRNERDLRLRGVLWFHPSGNSYVYYTPTHWLKDDT